MMKSLMERPAWRSPARFMPVCVAILTRLLSAWSGASDPVEFTWDVRLSGTRDEYVYPDVPFQWQASATAVEDHAQVLPYSAWLEARVERSGTERREYTAPGDGELRLSYTLQGTPLGIPRVGGGTVTLTVSDDTGVVLFDRQANSRITGTDTFPARAGRTYTVVLRAAYFGQIWGEGQMALSIQGTHRVPAETVHTNQASGFAIANAADGEVEIPVPLPLAPGHGGVLREPVLTCRADDPRVTLRWVRPGLLGASTQWRQHTVTRWTDARSGTARISANDGVLTLAALPVGATAEVSSSLPPDLLRIWAEQNTLYALLLRPPVVTPPLRLHARRLPAGSLELSWDSAAGERYRVLWAPALATPAWWVEIAAVQATGAQASFVDQNPSARLPQGYYRIQQDL